MKLSFINYGKIPIEKILPNAKHHKMQ